MKTTVEISGKLKQKAETALKAAIGQGSTAVVVGYTQKYALKVHEDMAAQHAKGKEAKYLETPARQMANDGTVSKIVRQSVKSGQGLREGLLKAGLLLQRESQKIVPIDTGALKASAFTAFEEEAEQKSAEAFAASEQIKSKGQK